MTTKCRMPMAVLAAFLCIFGFQYIYHGVLLMPAYEATASLWRPMSEMEQMFGWCLGTKLALAVLFAWLFGKNYEARGIPEGLRFGLYIGLIMGITVFSSYMYLPISLGLAAAWFAGEVLMGLLVGVALALVYRACPRQAA